MNNTELKGYASTWEHIADELNYIDLRIQFLLYLKREQELTTPSLEQQWKGLVITLEEVEQLLSLENKPSLSKDAKLEELLTTLQNVEQRIHARRRKSEDENDFLPLNYLSKAFQLSPFEEQVIMICLAIELNRKYEKLYAYLQDDLTCKWPTVDLVQKLIGLSIEETYWARLAFDEHSKLCRYFLRKEGTSSTKNSLLTRQLRLEERIIHFLLDIGQTDNAIQSFTTILYPQDELPSLIVGQEIQGKIREFVVQHYTSQKTVRRNMLFNLWGYTGSGRKMQASHFAQYAQHPLMIVNLKKMLQEEESIETLFNLVLREAIIQKVVLCFQDFQLLLEETESATEQLNKLLASLENFSGIVFFLTETRWKPANLFAEYIYIDIELAVPPDFERKRLWEELGHGYPFQKDVDLGIVASKFRFTPGQIKRALNSAQDLMAWESTTLGAKITVEALHKACYLQVQHKLEKKAKRIKPNYDWEDIILPEEQKIQLRNACNQIKYRHIVYGEWGFERKLSYGKGLSILFAGPPGTGKTMSAEVIAKELFLEIYKIDLSQVISKYIGETEKNLQEIFTEAQHSNAILFFDETDALFGKRSEVKDSHDKYANIEVAFLLQKMEEYQGISILATNLLQNIDEAFMRRINFVIKFPFPDVEQRERIWRAMFPKEAPVSEEVDFKFIAEKIQVAGGNIKNIVLSAAFLAAESGKPIGMQEIIEAAKHELQKSGKILLKEDIGDYFSP